jgi:hypothetical protein
VRAGEENNGLNSGNVYYISKRTLCSRSLAYDQLEIQPIAVSKVILRPMVRTGPVEGYDDRLEVLDDAMINDVVFLDRNVTGVESELSANVCPLHTVSIFPPRTPTRYTSSNIMFGVTMSVDDIPRALENWGSWARNSKASFYVLLPRADYSRMAEAEEMFRVILGVRVTVGSTRDTDDFGKLTIMLVDRMKSAAFSEVQWFMILSPRTFVTSLEDVLLTLEPYDATRALYMGALSEAKGQRDQYGTMAYGGAGIVLSRPLTEDVALHSTLILILN